MLSKAPGARRATRVPSLRARQGLGCQARRRARLTPRPQPMTLHPHGSVCSVGRISYSGACNSQPWVRVQLHLRGGIRPSILRGFVPWAWVGSSGTRLSPRQARRGCSARGNLYSCFSQPEPCTPGCSHLLGPDPKYGRSEAPQTPQKTAWGGGRQQGGQGPQNAVLGPSGCPNPTRCGLAAHTPTQPGPARPVFCLRPGRPSWLLSMAQSPCRGSEFPPGASAGDLRRPMESGEK